jgi:hypothetical protein
VHRAKKVNTEHTAAAAAGQAPKLLLRSTSDGTPQTRSRTDEAAARDLLLLKERTRRSARRHDKPRRGRQDAASDSDDLV